MGETERSLKAPFLERKRHSSTISGVSRHIHIDNPEHQEDTDGVNILAVKQTWFKGGVREAFHIKMEQPLLKRDGAVTIFPLSGTTG